MKIFAIDGGTYHTGWAYFNTDLKKKLVCADVISPVENGWSFDRIKSIIFLLSEYIRSLEPDVLVWESWRGNRNPELQVLLRCLRQLAKMYSDSAGPSGHKCEPVEIHASSVVKSIALDGKGRQRREARKLAIREGVAYHYPEYADTQQDLQDAVAIGHTYLVSQGVIH